MLMNFQVRTSTACHWLAGLFACLLATIAIAQEGPAFPALSGRIVDQAGLLDSAAETKLDAQLAAHEADTGNQIVIVTLKSLEGYAIADYANRLGRSWQIGTAENDNGVLLVVAPQERKVRIEVGYGLEGALTDALSSQIIRKEMLPAFRQDSYPRGIQQGVDSIIKAVAGEYQAEPASKRRKDDISSSIGGILPLIFIGMIAVVEFLRRSGRKRLANTAFPAGFAGLMGTLISGNLLIGIAVAVGLFTLIYLTGGSNGGGGNSSRRRHMGTGLPGGRMGGGSFGGGGGSFGGGGASGSW